MKFTISSRIYKKIPTDILVLFAFAKGEEDWVFLSDSDPTYEDFRHLLRDAAISEGFHGESGKIFRFHTHGKIFSKQIFLVGLGEKNNCTMTDWLLTMGAIGKEAKKIHAKTLAFSIAKEIGTLLGYEAVARGIVEGMLLGTYEFDKYKKKKDKHTIEEVFFLSESDEKKILQKGIEKGMLSGQATCFARNLINEPSSATTPSYLADVAKKIASENPSITCAVYGPKEMRSLGMGGIMGIAKGSSEEPRFITLMYKGKGKKTVALAGKGITFDTGGISLKPAEQMDKMKTDMSGAATILGLFSILSQWQIDVNVVGLIAAAENMPGGAAIKPGDVVTCHDGTTIEIINTDAEGRVILADTLSYAKTYHPDVLIDIATLTGACVVALGEEIAGLFTNDDVLKEKLLEASKHTGEELWPMPLPEKYEGQLKSTIADIKNITTTRYGGAITAALFLKAFVPKKMPWAHLDIAGPSYAEKDGPLSVVGGTGFGVRLLLYYLQFYSKVI